MLHSETFRNDQNYSTGLDIGATPTIAEKPPTHLYESDAKE